MLSINVLSILCMLTQFLYQCFVVDTIIIPTVEMSNLRYREFKELNLHKVMQLESNRAGI